DRGRGQRIAHIARPDIRLSGVDLRIGILKRVAIDAGPEIGIPVRCRGAVRTGVRTATAGERALRPEVRMTSRSHRGSRGKTSTAARARPGAEMRPAAATSD